MDVAQMDLAMVGIAVAIGVAAGAVGGLAGIGGSIVMLPALAFFFGYETRGHDEHHVYMAAAMCTNVFVALASADAHGKRGAIDKRVVRALLPSMSIGIVLGVLLSNSFEGEVAKLALVGFLIIYAVWSVVTALRKLPEVEDHNRAPNAGVSAAIGAGVGILAGFLGIGGGIVLVPLLMLVAKLPTRTAIACSSAVMWVTASVGATLKVATLPSLDLDTELGPAFALQLAALMAVGAQLGARFGAWAAHAMPVRVLKVAIALVLAVAGARMLHNTLNAPNHAADEVVGEAPALLEPAPERTPRTEPDTP